MTNSDRKFKRLTEYGGLKLKNNCRLKFDGYDYYLKYNNTKEWAHLSEYWVKEIISENELMNKYDFK